MSTSSLWKSSVDPKSGRTYYYNTQTRETTWTMPKALATPEQLIAMERDEYVKIEFFKEMEKNIQRKILEAKQSDGSSAPIPWASAASADAAEARYNSSTKGVMTEEEAKQLISSMDSRRRLNSSESIRRIRTISTMDDSILYERKSNEESPVLPRVSFSRPPPIKISDSSDDNPLPLRVRTGSFRVNDREGLTEMPLRLNVSAGDGHIVRGDGSTEIPALKKNDSDRRRELKRRNSTGTLYVTHTMSQQDNTTTIHCVCVVIRAHMKEAIEHRIVPADEYNVFHDSLSTPRNSRNLPSSRVPPLIEVIDFFSLIFNKSQLESDCIIMALIYCERLVKETRGKLCIRHDNWKSILFTCLVMASKVWDDLSMWNVDFSQVVKGFDLQRINQLELAMLNSLKYVIRVSASEYAKYYFHLRSMAARLQLTNDNSVMPLNIQGARKLQLATEAYQAVSRGRPSEDLATSAPSRGALTPMFRQNSTDAREFHSPVISVVLEQIVNMELKEAGGSVRKTKSPKIADVAFRAARSVDAYDGRK